MIIARRFVRILKASRRPLLFLHALLERIPFRPFHVACFQRYEMDYDLKPKPGGEVSVRLADAGDMEGIVRCMDKRRTYERRFAAGEYCLIALVGATVVGFEWFSTKSRVTEERYGYTIHVPEDGLYSYDANTAVDHRGRGVWRQVLAGVAEVMKKEKRTRLIAHVDYGNDASMVAHERVGFRPAGWFLYMSAFGVGHLQRLSGEPFSFGGRLDPGPRGGIG